MSKQVEDATIRVNANSKRQSICFLFQSFLWKNKIFERDSCSFIFPPTMVLFQTPPMIWKLILYGVTYNVINKPFSAITVFSWAVSHFWGKKGASDSFDWNTFQIPIMRTLLLLLVMIVACDVILHSRAETCYDAWSRCSDWSSAATGILWKTCADYCRKCKGKDGGSCQLRRRQKCGEKKVCVCSNRNVKRSGNPFDRISCGLGL